MGGLIGGDFSRDSFVSGDDSEALGTKLRRIGALLIGDSSSLTGKVLQGGAWAGALNFSDRALQLARTLILATILVPADFGLYGIALLLTTVPNLLVDPGFEEALIQREESDIDSYLDTVWTFRFGKSLFLYVVLMLASTPAASFFQTPSLVVVLPVVGLSLFTSNLVNPGVVYFKKELRFDREFVYIFGGSLVGFVAAIALGVTFRSHWALVAGLLGTSLTRLVLSFVIHGYRPGLSFDTEAASSLFEFGRWIQLNRVVTLGATRGDDLFVGRVLGSGALGLYQLAFRLSNAAATEVAHVIGSVLFPAFSKVQNNLQSLRSGFLRANSIVFLLAFPIGVGTALVTEPFVRVVLGPEWVEMIPAMQILALSGVVRAIASTGGVLFKGVGQPEWEFRSNVVRLVVIMLTIWPLSNSFGIYGSALSISLGVLSTLPIWVYKTREILKLSAKDYLIIATPPMVGSAAMYPAVVGSQSNTTVGLVLSIGVGIIVYTLVGGGLWLLGGRVGGWDWSVS
jgi:O-antigen/teichoic acid export membrane protein